MTSANPPCAAKPSMPSRSMAAAGGGGSRQGSPVTPSSAKASIEEGHLVLRQAAEDCDQLAPRREIGRLHQGVAEDRDGGVDEAAFDDQVAAQRVGGQRVGLDRPDEGVALHP